MKTLEAFMNTFFGKKEKNNDEENPLIKKQEKSFEELIKEIGTIFDSLNNDINNLKIKNEFSTAALQIKNQIDQLQNPTDAEDFLIKLKKLNDITSEYKNKDDKYENNISDEIDFEKTEAMHTVGCVFIFFSAVCFLYGAFSATNNGNGAIPFSFGGITFISSFCVLFRTQYEKALWKQNRVDRQNLLEEFKNLCNFNIKSTTRLSISKPY